MTLRINLTLKLSQDNLVSMNKSAFLILSTGEVFRGEHIGAITPSSGQLVFTTGMVGYTETLTDPSYFGQIITFSYPLIGNYGVANGFEDTALGFESNKIYAKGLIVGKISKNPSHFNSHISLNQWLINQGVIGISGIDTRAIVSHITKNTNVLAKISMTENDTSFDFYDPNCERVIDNVSTKKSFKVGKGKYRIGVIDCGVKRNMIRILNSMDCEVEVIPWNEDLKKYKVDGWLISNGPGDPEKTDNLKKKIQDLILEDKPILGICLGFQLLALASGAKTKRLPFGHRSFNQPVQLVGTLKGYLTSQNHGFVVDKTTLTNDWDPWFINANDETLEGIKHKSRPFMGVQFHPESSAGPNDTKWIMEEFVNLVKKSK